MFFKKTSLYKKLRNRLSTPPDKLPPEGHRFFSYSNIIYVLALCVHVLFIPLFILLRNYPSLAIDIACILLDMLMLRLNRNGYIRLSALLFISYVGLQIGVSIIIFGTGIGLYMFYLTLTEFLFFSTWRTWQKSALQAALILVSFGISYYALTRPPIVNLSPLWHTTIFVIVLMTNFIGLAYSTYYYLRISELADRKLKYHATHDFLTGIFNRNEITAIMEKECARALRHGSPLSVILCDIDFFKKVNDTYGHAEGDTVIRESAGIMLTCLRNTDYLGRYGGEEFIIILPGVRIAGAAAIADRIRSTIEHAQIMTAKGVISITMSMGVASSEHFRKPNADHILNAADEALYDAKRGGRNRVVPYLKEN